MLKGALVGAGLPLLRPFRSARAAARVQFGELEPLVRLVEETPRDRLIEAAAGKIRGGATHAQLLAAGFLAGVRGIRARPVGFEFHCVLAIHSAHLTAQDAPPADRWIPVLWALDQFKSSQQKKRDKHEGGWALALPDGARLPAPAQARQRYLQAMADWDEEGADRAITALVRATEPEAVQDLILRHGARDLRDIGHKAIYAANAWRTLKVIGWQHAEPVLRSLTFACLEHDGKNPSRRDAAEDRPWRENAKSVGHIRPGWRSGTKPADVPALLQTLRQAPPVEASFAVAVQLQGGTDPASIWDALFLGAAELVLRHLDIIALHAATSLNALHHAYQNAAEDETRLLMLLQAPAFLALFRQELGAGSNARIDALEPAALASRGPEAVAEILADLGPRTPRATARTLTLLEDARTLPALTAAARRLVLAKGDGAHDYKLSAAVLEDVHHVSPRWRARYLAATLGLFPGAQDSQNPLVERIRAALGRT